MNDEPQYLDRNCCLKFLLTILNLTFYLKQYSVHRFVTYVSNSLVYQVSGLKNKLSSLYVSSLSTEISTTKTL